MRILFVTYDHPLSGESGVSVYCRDLLPSLIRRGVEVGALCIQHRDWRLRPYLRLTPVRHITIFTLTNSPLDPGGSLYAPAQDSRQPAVESLFLSCLQRYRPDLVHFQTLHGYPGSVVAIARRHGASTVVMLHDFWAICPRVLLVRPNDRACDGPDEGRNCIRFCVGRRSWRQRVYELGMRLPEGWSRAAFLGACAAWHRIFRRDGQGSMWAKGPWAPMPPDGRLVSAHAARPRTLLEALKAADQLVAISDDVKSVFVQHGIAPDQIRVLPTTLDAQRITWRIRRTRGRHVRFGFLGRAVPVKGAHIFAQAIRGLPTDRARFLVFGPAPAAARRHLQNLAGTTPLEFYGGYAREDLPRILDQVDVVVVPPVAREPLGLTTIEAQAAGVPVIGARTGAIPEYVQDGRNGLLFSPGNPHDLRDKMLIVLGNPGLVETMSAQTKPLPGLAEHLDALMDIYASAVETGRRRSWTPSSA